MRRDQPISKVVRAPSKGLETRWPSESADLLATQGLSYAVPGLLDRVSTISKNTRYEDGVVRNAPGYDIIAILNSLTQGVVAHWSLDESSGATRLDSTPNHNDLLDQPGTSSVLDVTQTAGFFKFAAQFNAIPPPILVSIAITPITPSLYAASTQQFIAIGTFDDSSTLDITAFVNWTSDTSSVATISSGGLLTALTAGVTTVSASITAITESTVATVVSDYLTNMVLRWNMNEGSGFALTDSSSSHNDGTCPLTDWVPGKVGTGIEFSGASADYASRSATPDPIYNVPEGASPISLMIWAKCTQHPLQNLNSCLFGYGIHGVQAGDEIVLQISGDTIGVTTDPADGGGYIYWNRPTDLLWHHYAVVWPGGLHLSSMQLYIDGILQTFASNTSYQDGPPNIPAFNTDQGMGNYNVINIALFPRITINPGSAPDAVVDDFRIYDIALTQVEISAIFNGGAA